MSRLVSVIVPIYNVEQYLTHCINSILQQSYENLEIILVEDGSPDNSGRICDEFSTKDHRIIVIHKQNGGLSDARNAGIDIATGDYVTFVDSDDYIMPDMIESLVNILIKENIDIAQCAYKRCQCDCIDSIKQGLSRINEFTVYTESKMSAYLRNKIISTVSWGKIYKKSLFNEIRFPVGRLHEDVFTTYKLIHRADSVAVTNYIGYIYRINENSITTSKFSPQKLDSIYGKIECAEFIEKNYPDLSKQAYSEIIYACNQCLLQMAEYGFAGENEDTFLQRLYRQYGKYYICDKVSALGKVVTILAMVNEQLAKSAISLKR